MLKDGVARARRRGRGRHVHERRRGCARFLAEQIADAEAQGVLFSLHLKATMMKVSDPIIFGHAVEVYFADVFAEHGDALRAAGANPRDGLGDVLDRRRAPRRRRRSRPCRTGIAAALESGPDLAMVDSDRGITNLHVPSDVIIDASMPPMIRDSGKMWNPAGELQDTKATIPDSSYAGDLPGGHRRPQGPRRPRPPHDGHGAQRRPHGPEGRGVRQPRQDLRDPRRRCGPVLDESGAQLMEHRVEAGDIWRMSTVKDAAGPGLGEARRQPGPGHRLAGRVLARRAPGPTTHQLIAQGPTATSADHDTERPRPSRSWRRPTAIGSRSSGSGGARTPSRSPATCCATTSPTCSRSSRSAPAPRCSRSSR